ncbi:hypothetical protein XENOCAPTIV_028286, partial [Xenoophorus captivus]
GHNFLNMWPNDQHLSLFIPQGADIIWSQHQQMIVWIGEMSRLFQFCPETFALGVCVLNRLLSTVKFHALLVSGHPHLAPSFGLGSGVGAGAIPIKPRHQKTPPSGFQAALWTRQVQHCMACHQLWQFKGSTLALAIITLELEALTPDCAEFIHCKEIVDEYLHSMEFSLPANSVYILDSSQIQEHQQQQVWSPSQRHLAARRVSGGSEQGDLDDYYDGFRHLYNEESDMEDLFEFQQKGVSPCPPLHPADN